MKGIFRVVGGSLGDFLVLLCFLVLLGLIFVVDGLLEVSGGLRVVWEMGGTWVFVGGSFGLFLAVVSFERFILVKFGILMSFIGFSW